MHPTVAAAASDDAAALPLPAMTAPAVECAQEEPTSRPEQDYVESSSWARSAHDDAAIKFDEYGNRHHAPLTNTYAHTVIPRFLRSPRRDNSVRWYTLWVLQTSSRSQRPRTA